MNEFWIYDIEMNLPDNIDGICALSGVARCTGCFGCWLKTPGECVMHDGKEGAGECLTNRETVRIISRICYGGFSPGVKRVLDRSISGILPFFSYRHGRMHHAARYKNQPVFHILFHDCAQVSEDERKLAEKAARAMSINMNAKECNVYFCDKPVFTTENIK